MNLATMSLIRYLLANYPYSDELSASRLTKMMYLIDWKSAIENGRQVTDAKWFFNHYGPYVDDFIEYAIQSADIDVNDSVTVLGGAKRLISLKNKNNDLPVLDPEVKTLADFVINVTKTKHYQDFINLVYSTYPVMTSERYSNLDLVESARRYKSMS
ncbi:DUF4065 domain-containing protein [Halomonas litopenaei]|nr:DUF4065 domain-containing protein [Halomonas litopenaei]